MKCKAFEHKLVYYATYDVEKDRYTVIHDYNKPLYVFYFYVTNYLLKLNYAGVSYLDIELLLKMQQVIIITTYIMNGEEHSDVFNEHTYNNQGKSPTFVYAFTNTQENLTYEFNLFSSTLLLLKLSAYNIARILYGFKRKDMLEPIKNIHYMTDDDFVEKTI